LAVRGCFLGCAAGGFRMTILMKSQKPSFHAKPQRSQIERIYLRNIPLEKEDSSVSQL
jgi:hypothetical protein